jgi:hypothetical protein
VWQTEFFRDDLKKHAIIQVFWSMKKWGTELKGPEVETVEK